VANTLNLFRNGAVGFIDWLDRLRMQLTPNDNPARDAERNEKRDLPERNLLEAIRKWLKNEQCKPNCRERADRDAPRESCAARATPQTDGKTEEGQAQRDERDCCAEPVTTPMIWLQSHHGAAATENVPVSDSGVHAQCADGEEKTTKNRSDRTEHAHTI
jgi:hypothetical protein